VVSQDKSKAAAASIILSCATTAFTSVTLWYDYDTSPLVRTAAPLLFGATPDTGRLSFFFLLVASATCQVVAKTFSSALLLVVDKKWFLVYLASDQILYQLYSVARCDHFFFHHQSNRTLSVVFRIGIKLIADFTSCWLLR
jgi:hypothetical protein